MKPSPALLEATAAALKLLLEPAGPADALLHAFFRAHPQLGQRERAFVAETCFGVLRHLLALRELAPGRSPRRVMLACLARWGSLSLRELEPFLRGDEGEWLASLKAVTAESFSFAAQAELPEWLVERLRPALDDAGILELGRALQQPAPMDLRVNLMLAKREEVLARLAADGIAARPTPYSPAGVRLAERFAINRHPLYLEGKVEVQDEGSQLLGYLVAPR